MEPLTAQTALESLRITNCEGLSLKDLEPLASLPALKGVQVSADMDSPEARRLLPQIWHFP